MSSFPTHRSERLCLCVRVPFALSCVIFLYPICTDVVCIYSAHRIYTYNMYEKYSIKMVGEV